MCWRKSCESQVNLTGVAHRWYLKDNTGKGWSVQIRKCANSAQLSRAYARLDLLAGPRICAAGIHKEPPPQSLRNCRA
ncbi:hypothetical protein [Candidatus Vallotia lariciata]|uniref:hypothetical protein n=1 Tax=Candidatus Vallotia laricis TaxID=2018052 RepID=UPI001D01216F|nr:hypothetical protein [Candidatus Vallotia lariciata]